MYKFKINENLGRLTKSQKREAVQDLSNLLNVTVSRVNMIRSAVIGDSTSCSAEQLKIISDYFGCGMNEIVNF